MKYFALAALLMVGLTLMSCGSSSHSNATNINGNWNASLTSGNSPVFAFGTSFTVNGDGSLAISNFSFTSNSSCFVSGETENGSFTLSGDFNGNVSGKFGFNVQSGSPSGNTLVLTGTVNGNTISGTWTLTGSAGCTGSGTFTMTKM